MALLGCRSFPPGDVYASRFDGTALDPHSDAYVASMVQAGNREGFWMAARPVEYVNIATPQTPRIPVRPKVKYHRFDFNVPWSDGMRIEPLADAHAVVLDPESCDVFEFYQATYQDGALSAYSGAHWRLDRPFAPLPPGTPSAMASGLSLYAGMVRWDEVARGEIDHPLNWAPPAGTVAQWSFVRPASDTDGIPFRGTSAYALPYGAHLRLRASFDSSGFGPQSAAIVRAMKRYGIILADTSTSDNQLYDDVPSGGLQTWDATDLAALASIHISDFEVLRLGPVYNDPGH